ncbi:protein kinase [Trypanosoma rangeli]|uniref:Protein kinase n=1 Tax=Trypanosoma rangeli TaxID=5698 RepID=A0A3R7KR58_TRYRA|nr:protein kinase [Trypanosoma rangeli]RNE99711.1 protein kinase [Trypanosoma rangeli]|eukprot:RNE99711.1 protein kinase [Trypanosoma rangeli]
MSTLPPLPTICILSVRYVTESFVAERQTECWTFLSAVVERHFFFIWVCHPQMVRLLWLEPHLNKYASVCSTILGGTPRCGKGSECSTHKLGRENSVMLPMPLNEDALDQLRVMSRHRPDCQVSTSSLRIHSFLRCLLWGIRCQWSRRFGKKVQLGNLIDCGSFCGGSFWIISRPLHSGGGKNSQSK